MKRIEINNEVLAGKPIVKGTRISVEFILEMLSSGMSMDEILREYPHLEKEDILSALEYAVKILKKEEFYSLQ